METGERGWDGCGFSGWVVSNSCDPMDCGLPASSVHGISQTRILEWVAISFSRGSSQPGDRTASPAQQADSLLLSPEYETENRKIRIGGWLWKMRLIFEWGHNRERYQHQREAGEGTLARNEMMNLLLNTQSRGADRTWRLQSLAGRHQLGPRA